MVVKPVKKIVVAEVQIQKKDKKLKSEVVTTVNSKGECINIEDTIRRVIRDKMIKEQKRKEVALQWKIINFKILETE